MISQREADDIAFKNDLTGGNQCKIYVKSCNFEERNLVRISSVIKNDDNYKIRHANGMEIKT